MNIDVNDLLRSSYEWYCATHNIEQIPYTKLHVAETNKLINDIKNEIIDCINKSSDTTFEKHENLINIIRLSNVLAYVNGVNANKWISMKI